VVAEHVQMTAN